jgi:alpha-glucoside transport system substrate-binding protein
MKISINYLISSLVILASLLGACSGRPAAATEGTPGAATPEMTAAAPEATPRAEATEPAGQSIGGTVTVMGVWSDAELDNFLAMVARFEEQTGIEVEYQPARDLRATLDHGIERGTPPDIAGLPNPAVLRQYVAQNALVPLDDVVDIARLRAEYPAAFTDLARVDGQTYGVFVKATVKNLVWYRPDIFQERGYPVPQTWQELLGLEQQIIADGVTPWCIGVASRWPGTDWIEDLMLRTAGPEAYDAWWQHTMPWTDPAVATAWESWGRIVGDPAMAYGGPTFILSNTGGESSSRMFAEEPGCFLHHQASFFTTFIANEFPDVQLGDELNFFPFPPIDEQHGGPLLAAGDLFGIFNDTPQAQALIEYLTTAEAQAIWAERGGYVAPNRAVSPAVYPDDIARSAAQSYVEAESVRFDASDLMPQAVQDAFTSGILQFIQDPGTLPSVLEDIESAAQRADEQ